MASEALHVMLSSALIRILEFVGILLISFLRTFDLRV